MAGLRPKQQRFVDEYLVDLNATKAAIRAGYSPKVAYRQGYENLRKPHIAHAIAEAQALRSERTHITQDKVLQELAILDFSNVEHFEIDDYGNVTVKPDAPQGAIRAVASLRKRIRHDEAGVSYETEIKFWNKPASLRMSGQHLGMFTEKIEVSGNIGIVQLPSKAPDAETWLAETQHLHPERNGHAS